MSGAPATSADPLRSWRDELARLESCPWAGPRPLRGAGDSWQLVGRERDKADFLDDVLRNALVILEAESGVGKSSLLQSGLIPLLEAQGYQPLYYNVWADGGSDVDKFFADHLDEEHGLEPLPDETFSDMVQRSLGPGAVVILDQFEELMRHASHFYDRVIDWVVNAVESFDFKIVVSLRSEYSHRLRHLEQELGPFVDIAHFTLEPIADEAHVRELLQPSADRVNLDVTIDDTALSLLLKVWTEHRLGSQPTGLLQLHSMLYASHGSLPEGTTIIDETTVKSLLGDREDLSDDAVFRPAMLKTVELKMTRCERALSALSHDEHGILADGTRAIARALVRHLSSGGYKLVRELWDLAQLALHRELDVLVDERGRVRGTDIDARELFTPVSMLIGSADSPLLSSDWIDLVPQEYQATVLGSGQPWEVDPYEATSGAMFAMHPALVLIEEFRRFLFAVTWLEASSLIRITSAPKRRSMVSLVHDGFGAALESWSRSVGDLPSEGISRLTATRGDRFAWDQVVADQEIVNVRWQDCVIQAAFERVVFVNCDFRNSRFLNCRFEGVAFLNCLLDGVTIDRSHIIGGVGDYDEPYPKGVPPSFTVRARTPGLVAGIARYRGLSREARQVDRLVSHTSGLPAVPFTAEHEGVLRPEGLPSEEIVDGLPTRIMWKREPGGIVMYGGRLCSLMIRQCRFETGGTLALRQVSGSALDVVECSKTMVRLSVYGSAIRGLTVTLGAADDRNADEDDGIDIDSPSVIRLDAVDAVMAETWFGTGLRGEVNLDDALVWQLVNFSDLIEVNITDSPSFGLVNVHVPQGDSDDLSEVFAESGIIDPHGKQALLAATMDYQSDPARGEFDRRRRETPHLLWPALHGSADGSA